MVVKKVKLLTRLKQAKGNKSEQINTEYLHDSDTFKNQAGKTQYALLTYGNMPVQPRF